MAQITSTSKNDSLTKLLNKVHSISCMNKDNLDFIQSRNGQQVILDYQYSLKIKNRPTQRRKLNNHNQKHSRSSDSDDRKYDLLTLFNHKHTKPVDNIIAAWKYEGDPLTAEKIAFDHFIDIRLNKFGDLVRLHDDYLSLYEKYSRVLHDEPESVAAVDGLLKNLEKVHVAIREVHVQVLDAKDPMEDGSFSQRLQSLSHDLSELTEEIPILDIVMSDQEDDDEDLVQFENLTPLSCKKTMKHSSYRRIWDMKCINVKCFSDDDRQFVPCGLDDGSIPVWNLTSQAISFTLTGHTSAVHALATYKKEGIQMLASGSRDKTIKLWNLLNRSLVATLSGHSNSISSLSTYKNNGKVYLASGCDDRTIKIWDIENNASLITTLKGHGKSVTFKTYLFDGIPYLVSGDWNGKIKIWNLSTHTLMRTLDTNNKKIRSLAVTNHNNKIIIACGCNNGAIEICDLENNIFTVLSTSTKYDEVRCLAFTLQGSQLYLLSLHWNGSLKCWNMADRSNISTFDFGKGSSLMTYEIRGEPCIVTGGDDGQISIWNGKI